MLLCETLQGLALLFLVDISLEKHIVNHVKVCADWIADGVPQGAMGYLYGTWSMILQAGFNGGSPDLFRS